MKDTTRNTIKLFWRYAGTERKLGLVCYLGFTVSFVIGLVPPLFYKKFFDLLESSIGNPAAIATDLIRIVLIVLGLNLVKQAIFYLAALTFNRFQPRTLERMDNDNFDYLHGHSFNFFVNRFVGSIVRKANRLLSSFENTQDRLAFDFLPLVVRIVVVSVVLFSWYPLIGALTLGWLVLFLGLSYVFAMYRLKYDLENARIDSEASGYLADTVTNQQNVKLFSAAAAESQGFRAITSRLRQKLTFVYDLNARFESVQSMLMAALELAVFFIAIRQWEAGQLSIGDFALIQAYLIAVLLNIWQFGHMVQRVYRDLANAEEMTDMLMLPHEVQDKRGAKALAVSRGEVRFEHVTFAYHKTRAVVRDFSLAVAPGEKIGLVGPSGAGKTTIVGLLFRFFDKDAGKILIDGQDVADVTQGSLRRAMAFVPQDPVLFHRTLKENIRYGQAHASDEEVGAAARAAHCDEFITRLPNGFDTYVGERGVKLSGGERQRVAIARAILKNAPILVLDEATSSLDSHVEAMIQDALARLMEGKTTIVIAHRLSTINKMDRIVVVEDGRIKEEGAHADLLKQQDGLYQKLWSLQAGGFIG
ncbi:MAG: ABC transporter ATP-binding protein [Candidatus Kerfeldbacteria bacterium]|nr:ABC transporter ATP-binding protein [Candidatus Kerfeldbacteria bacterium]